MGGQEARQLQFNYEACAEEHPWPERRGYVQVYTGDGKGKTTAALGLAFRAAGAGLRVFVAQFAKCGLYSEVVALRRFSDAVTLRQYGRGGWLRGAGDAEDARLAREGLAEVRRAVTGGRYDVVILDEADIAVYFGLFAVEDLLELIDAKPDAVELVITGRGADPRIVERADLVTEMREVKHYYRQGVMARKGIES
jgi:cob(I)alamin adenosyltransferase